jgi:hypothetical protein
MTNSPFPRPPRKRKPMSDKLKALASIAKIAQAADLNRADLVYLGQQLEVGLKAREENARAAPQSGK